MGKVMGARDVLTPGRGEPDIMVSMRNVWPPCAGKHSVPKAYAGHPGNSELGPTRYADARGLVR